MVRREEGQEKEPVKSGVGAFPLQRRQRAGKVEMHSLESRPGSLGLGILPPMWDSAAELLSLPALLPGSRFVPAQLERL